MTETSDSFERHEIGGELDEHWQRSGDASESRPQLPIRAASPRVEMAVCSEGQRKVGTTAEPHNEGAFRQQASGGSGVAEERAVSQLPLLIGSPA